MNSEQIASLFTKLGFKVDLTGINQYKALLKQLQAQATATSKAIEKTLKGGSAANTARQLAAAQKANFAAQMQQAKFSRVEAENNSKSLIAQTKEMRAQSQLRVQQAKESIQAAAAQRRAAKDNLLLHGQALANQVKQSRIANLSQQRDIRAAKEAARLQRIARQQAGLTNNHASPGRFGHGGLLGVGNSAIQRFGGLGRMAGLQGGMTANGLGGLSQSLGGAATGLGAVAGAALLTAAALAAVTAAAYGFAREAERASNTKTSRMSQFKVAAGSDAGAKAMEARFETFAQIEGLSTTEVGRDYAKIVGAMSKKMGADRATNSVEGILRYAKSQNLSSEEVKNMSRGMLQSLGKNQLYSEEWTGQISEHLGANANELGAMAYQRATGGKKTGQEAADQFLKDRTDKKIRGDVLVKFFENLGTVMNERANDGGALDKARNSQESHDNRYENQLKANMARAYDNTGLDKTMPELYGNLTKALNALDPQFQAAGKSANFLLTALNSLVKGFTYLTNMFNSESSIDPRFFEELSASIEAISISFGELWSSITNTLGAIADTGAPQAAFKTFGEVILGVVTTIINVITAVVDELVALTRATQDAQHTIGFINDDRYEKILSERKVADQRKADINEKRQVRQDIRDGKIAPTGMFPIPLNPPQQSQAPSQPMNGPIGVMALQPPATSPLQPAVNGQAVSNTSNNTSNVINFTAAPVTINGVAPDQVKAHLDEYQREQELMLQRALARLSPAPLAAQQSRSRSN